ncbi:heme o synthase [Buchnera aphidicola]|uniref:heme o synthase n=1 Tax=Buchnera aphidicola TaxID=9 RepID=UPI003464D938
MIKSYINLIKPGIVFANIFSLLGGFYFSSSYKYNIYYLLIVVCATICVISSSCIFNNIIDIDIDKNMSRTKNRVLVQSKKYLLHIKFFGIFLFLLSIFIFLNYVNFLSCVISCFAFFIYVIVYSYYMKRVSMYSVIIGSISGAIPPVIGYCSITNAIDLKVFFLFLIFIIWQIPHSYSIFIFRNHDYYDACLPTIVYIKGVSRTLKEIIFYIFLFCIFSYLFFFLSYISFLCFLFIFSLGLVWLFIACMQYFFLYNLHLSRLLFYWSIIVIMSLNFVLIFKN